LPEVRTTEAKAMPGGNGNGQKARDRKPHRVFDSQRPRRRVEASARKEAVKLARWMTSGGTKLEEVSDLIGVPVRTLRHWRASWRESRLAPRLRGRRTERPDYKTRTDILEVLNLMGPRTGMPTLRPIFPDVPRSALRSMLHRFRDVRLHFEDKRSYTLQWTRPGAVWAIDHKDRKAAPIDGRYPFALAGRDLGANWQFDWLPVESKAALITDDVLEARFREFGPPLVLKTDGGFAADSTRELLKRRDVFLLLSPPALPRYNGSIEAGICSMTARTDHHAARSARPGEWSCEDLEAARLEANETSRPRGSKGPTPDEVWRDREPITAEEREAFKRTVRKHGRWWRKVVVGSKPSEEVTQFDDDEIIRKSVGSALEALGYLRKGRGSYCTTFPEKSGKLI
jgi:hypothetical protein